MEFFLCLLLAHLVADFVFQTSASCKSKAQKHWRSVSQYIHALIVYALTWLASWDLCFWWAALIIVAHLCTDIWKSYRPEKITWFALDQALHVGTLTIVAWQWLRVHNWSMPFGIELKYVAAAVAAIVCWKPVNFFIKLMLKHYSVNMPEEKESGFNAGALIGTIERWLILIFVCLGHQPFFVAADGFEPATKSL